MREGEPHLPPKWHHATVNLGDDRSELLSSASVGYMVGGRNGRQRVRGWDSDAILSDMKKLSRLNHRTAKFAEISDMSTSHGT